MKTAVRATNLNKQIRKRLNKLLTECPHNDITEAGRSATVKWFLSTTCNNNQLEKLITMIITLSFYLIYSKMVKCHHFNIPVINKMDTRWNHFNTFELCSCLITIVVNAKFTASWQIKKNKRCTIIK